LGRAECWEREGGKGRRGPLKGGTRSAGHLKGDKTEECAESNRVDHMRAKGQATASRIIQDGDREPRGSLPLAPPAVAHPRGQHSTESGKGDLYTHRKEGEERADFRGSGDEVLWSAEGGD